ncbi:hypothetical protein [Arcobacter sp.]|uniref:hypothetical protein n=1 Tax=unclassified Arcobacter TaxID=2593671 RepID=UPI003AFFFF75
MLNVEFLQGMSGEKVFKVNSKHDFGNKEAIRLVAAGIAKPTNKKAYETALKEIEEEETIQKEKEEQAAAILHKDELEAERSKLQIRVDEITHSLGDGENYYKSYAGLGENNDNANDNKKDDLSKDNNEGEGK